jgi:hypothetical protein
MTVERDLLTRALFILAVVVVVLAQLAVELVLVLLL